MDGIRTLTAASLSPTRSQPPGTGQPSGTLLDQAAAFAETARAAYRACQHGQDAVEELHRRRNRSGQ